jgi:hypothetical protein
MGWNVRVNGDSAPHMHVSDVQRDGVVGSWANVSASTRRCQDRVARMHGRAVAPETEPAVFPLNLANVVVARGDDVVAIWILLLVWQVLVVQLPGMMHLSDIHLRSNL